MKLVCTQENLKKAIAHAERAVGRQSTLPILGNFLLETENGRLKLSATNLEIGVIVRVGAKVESEGKITVPAKLFGNFISNLPAGETVTLESADQALKITSGNYQVRIKGLDAQEFPLIPQSAGETYLMLPAQALKTALARLLPCVALTETRMELTGVNMLFTEHAVHLAATDSFRLAEEVIELEDPSEKFLAAWSEQGSFIVPAATLQEVLRVVGPETKSLKFSLEENQIFFEADGVQILSRLVSGRFPDYKQIIPPTFALTATLSREEMARAVRIATAFTSQNSQEVRIRLEPQEKQVIVESRSQEMGENKTILLADISGETPLEIIFHPRYLLDGINAAATAKVMLLANESTTPAALKMVNEETGEPFERFVYIVMPVRS